MNTNMKGISRIDAERAVGWYVRVYRSEEHRKFFSDSLHGGKEGALAAAIEYRDQFVAENPPAPKLPYRTAPSARNTSGRVGITKTFTRSGNRKIVYDILVVNWQPMPGVKRTKTFWVHQYETEEDALADATRFREEKELEMQERWNKGNRGKGHGYYLVAEKKRESH